MFKPFLLIALLSSSHFLAVNSAYANTANNEKNYSGAYSCKGNNSKVGDYAFNLTLKLNKSNSRDDVSVYDLTGETENSTMYSGNAVAIGNKMSLAFRVSDQKDNVFGSGMASFRGNQEKLWTFTTHYFEPDETGGVSGTDVCTQLAPVSPKKAPEDSSAKDTPAKEVTPKKVPEDVTPKEAPVKKPNEDITPKKVPEDVTHKKAPEEAPAN